MLTDFVLYLVDGCRTTKLLYDCELAGKKKEVTADLDDVIRDGFRHKSDYDLALAQGEGETK